ncbi:MAG: glycosyltransferase family 4 protein [Burkholderiales bacterium]
MSGAYFAPALSFVLAYAIIWWLVTRAAARLPVDTPNDRSLHSTPVPRAGGIGLHAGAVTAVIVIAPTLTPELWIAFAMLLAISLIDDFRALPVRLRLVVHLSAAAVFVIPQLANPYGMAVAAAAVLATAWMINLYNFMDGSDGLAGGMTLFGFAFYAMAAWTAGSTGFALVNAGVAAAAAAFLVFNFHPARIFLGDAGSVPLGFLAAAFGLTGWLQRDWTWWFPVLVFSPFIVDASVTLLRRLLSGARIWEAHRDHYYQRLVQMRFGHRGTAFVEYLVMAACGLGGLLSMKTGLDSVVVLLAASVFYSAAIAGIEYAWHERRLPDA